MGARKIVPDSCAQQLTNQILNLILTLILTLTLTLLLNSMHAIVSIQLNTVTCPTYPDKFIRDNVVAPSV